MNKLLLLLTLLISCNLQAFRFEDLKVKKIKKLKMNEKSVRSVAFDPNKKTLATFCYYSDIIQFWNLSDLDNITCKKLYAEKWASSFAYSPSGKKFFLINKEKLTMYDSSTLKEDEILLDITKKASELDIEEHIDPIASYCRYTDMGPELRTYPWTLAVHPNLELVAFPYNDFSILLCNTLKRKLAKRKRYTFDPKGTAPFYLTFSPCGNNLASTTRDGSVYLWKDVLDPRVEDKKSRIELYSSRKDHNLTSPGIARCVAFNPNGDLLSAALPDGIVRLWDLSQRDLKCNEFKGHTKDVTFVSFSPNRKILASCSFDGTIRLWNLSSLENHCIVLDKRNKCVRFAIFISDSILASGHDDGTINIWHLYEEEEEIEGEGESEEEDTGHEELINNMINTIREELIQELSIDN